MKGDKKVTIAATPAAASVQINGQMVGAGTASIEAAPQKLEVTVVAPGYTSYTEPRPPHRTRLRGGGRRRS
jgi:hypothetical protein